jgi:two-component system, OmpR family, KDP operon response regulator KdpE
VKATILVVEDEPDIRKFLRSSLGSEGYRVVESPNGRRAKLDAGMHKPDLAIVDLGLPDFDGVQVIRHIREWSPMPIIVLSARIHERSKIDALDSGADDYIRRRRAPRPRAGGPPACGTAGKWSTCHPSWPVSH